MTLFHEIKPDKREDALCRGLMQGDGGDKRNAAINKADAFLRELQPGHLVRAGVDRQANIFCYLTHGKQVLDITTGDTRDPAAIARDHGAAMLRVEADERRCYVSDIDAYDQIKDLLIAGKIAQARQRAPAYWQHVIPLAKYAGQFRRPEVLVTYDIPSSGLSTIARQEQDGH